jgi:hypothetical protein
VRVATALFEERRVSKKNVALAKSQPRLKRSLCRPTGGATGFDRIVNGARPRPQPVTDRYNFQ